MYRLLLQIVLDCFCEVLKLSWRSRARGFVVCFIPPRFRTDSPGKSVRQISEASHLTLTSYLRIRFSLTLKSFPREQITNSTPRLAAVHDMGLPLRILNSSR